MGAHTVPFCNVSAPYPHTASSLKLLGLLASPETSSSFCGTRMRPRMKSEDRKLRKMVHLKMMMIKILINFIS